MSQRRPPDRIAEARDVRAVRVAFNSQREDGGDEHEQRSGTGYESGDLGDDRVRPTAREHPADGKQTQEPQRAQVGKHRVGFAGREGVRSWIKRS